MELKDTLSIAAPVETVFAALTDPETVRACIPGCESLVPVTETRLQARVALKLGPVRARFSGLVELDVSGAPRRITLSGRGDGGIAGFAQGGADVELIADGQATILTYVAKAEIGGKIAQIGARLIDGTARKLASEFFNAFKGIVEDTRQMDARYSPRE
jgi:carbon monoxide dehydrogenase subunit G